MEQKNMFKQMIDFNSAAFNNTFNTMVTLQDQMEKATNSLIDLATWLPEEGRNAIKGWVGACKEGRENLKTSFDENFKKSEDFFQNRN